jgi:hypothetical protein
VRPESAEHDISQGDTPMSRFDPILPRINADSPISPLPQQPPYSPMARRFSSLTINGR